MKYLLIIMLLTSCSSHQRTTEEKVKSKWIILENAVSEKWTPEKILERLGKPKEMRSNKGGESWYYQSSENGYQEWSIGIKGGIVTGLIYFPTGSMNDEFTLDKILKRWKKFNCKKKKSERYMKGHTVYQDQYYLCDGNKRIEYDRYNEVSWIRVN